MQAASSCPGVRHLLAECVFDEWGLMGPVDAEGLPEPLCVGLEAALAASAFESRADLSASQSRGAAAGATLRGSRASATARCEAPHAPGVHSRVGVSVFVRV